MNANQKRTGEQRWCTTCNQQGWSEASQIIHLEGFLRDKGLFEEFADYAERAANEENGDERVNVLEGLGYPGPSEQPIHLRPCSDLRDRLYGTPTKTTIEAGTEFEARKSVGHRPDFDSIIACRKAPEGQEVASHAAVEAVRSVVDHLLQLGKEYGFQQDVDSVREAVEESANLLCIDLDESQTGQACDLVLEEQSEGRRGHAGNVCVTMSP